MPQNWKTYKLGDCSEVKGGKRLPKGITLLEEITDHPYIRVTNMGTKRIPKNELLYVPNSSFNAISRYIVNTNDVIISIVGTIGAVSLIDEQLNDANITENCVKLTNLKELDSEYLYYYLISNTGQHEINKGVVGSTQPKLPLYNIKDIEIVAPEIPEQTAIASILSALDDKIELNLQQNKTLEEMAMALYKHWFVDFGPFQEGEFVESELGMIPKGWEIVNLNEIARVINGRAYKNVEFLEEGTPIIRIQNLTGGGKTVFSDLKLNEDKYVESGDLIYAWSATFGPYFWHGPKSIYHYHIWKLEVVKEVMSKYYLFQHLARASAQMKEHGTGSIFTHLTKGTMEAQRILLPPKNIMDDYHSLSSVYNESILNNKDENQTLTNLRDTLLPKLITGEVRVKDVEHQLKDVL